MSIKDVEEIVKNEIMSFVFSEKSKSLYTCVIKLQELHDHVEKAYIEILGADKWNDFTEEERKALIFILEKGYVFQIIKEQKMNVQFV